MSFTSNFPPLPLKKQPKWWLVVSIVALCRSVPSFLMRHPQFIKSMCATHPLKSNAEQRKNVVTTRRRVKNADFLGPRGPYEMYVCNAMTSFHPREQRRCK